jgi:hypothetical protein
MKPSAPGYAEKTILNATNLQSKESPILNQPTTKQLAEKRVERNA